MSELTLPSGRVVDLKELTYGDHLDAQDAAERAQDSRVYTLHILRTATGFSDEELLALKVADGRAIDRALKREIDTGSPFDKASSPTSSQDSL